MKVLIAPNSLKNAANAAEIADAIAEGFLRASPGAEIRKMPLADGGEYTLAILLSALGGEKVTSECVDPLGRTIRANYGMTKNNTAIIELSQASGYELLDANQRRPLLTSTFGTGLQIKDALEKGCNKIILTLGGSATVDGGGGILQALDVRLLDKNGNDLPPGGGNLIILDRFDDSTMENSVRQASFTILCDVKNPLLGKNGAAMVFAPQKGAGYLETILLERCLSNFGSKCEQQAGRSLIRTEGAGAAGGVAAGLMTFFDTKIVPGTSFILDLLQAEDHLEWADLVITAEGSLDQQTYGGKAPSVLASRAKKRNKRVICIAGKVPHRVDQPDKVFDAVFAMQNQPMSLEDSIRNTLVNIRNTAYEIGRIL